MEEQRVICKACAFVMDAHKLKAVCPACGVPAKMFEPFVDKVSFKRRTLLALDLHPVMVHFPQAFTATLLVLSAALLLVPTMLRESIEGAIIILGISLPFTVILSFGSGLFDGRVRFRKLNAPLLRKKMAFGTLFFVLACAIAFFTVSGYLTHTLPALKIALLSAFAMAIAAWLGLAGAGLVTAKFPG